MGEVVELLVACEGLAGASRCVTVGATEGTVYNSNTLDWLTDDLLDEDGGLRFVSLTSEGTTVELPIDW